MKLHDLQEKVTSCMTRLFRKPENTMITRSLTCDHSGCRRRTSQFLQTWIDTLICRCEVHRIQFTDMRKDIREIGPDEAQVLAVHGK